MNYNYVYSALGLVFALNILYVNCLMMPLVPSENYTHFFDVAAPLFSGQYMLYWKLIAPNIIQFESHYQTTGWVGIGISPDGSMAGADIAIGWVNATGSAFLKVKFNKEHAVVSIPLSDVFLQRTVILRLSKPPKSIRATIGFCWMETSRMAIQCLSLSDNSIKPCLQIYLYR